jgi:hypothetical protein
VLLALRFFFSSSGSGASALQKVYVPARKFPKGKRPDVGPCAPRP